MNIEQQLLLQQEVAAGGEWLKAARTWMQSNVHRGDSICWGDRNVTRRA